MNLRIPDDVQFRILGGEAVILNLATGVYFGLNDVGTRMWQGIADHGSTDRIVETVMAEYHVEERQCRQDLNQLILKLSERGLVKTDAETNSPSE